MNIAEGFLILATLAGPFFAVQAQKWIERGREQQLRRQRLFYALMTTRALRISADHVRALNNIDLEFTGERKYQDVIERWRIYHDHLNQGANPGHTAPPNQTQIDAWVLRGDDLFTDLLHAMGLALGYKFDRVLLKRGSYFPRAHSEEQKAQEDIRDSLVKILSGAQPIHVALQPVNDEAARNGQAVQEALSGKTPLKFIVVNDDKSEAK